MRPLAVAPVLALAALLAAAPSAGAQPGVVAPVAPPSSVEGPPSPRAPLAKARPGAHRPAVAFGLSFGVTIGLFIAGEEGAFDEVPEAAVGLLVVAPSVGRWYVGEVGVLGMATRLGGVVLIYSSFGDHSYESVPALVAGATLIIGGTLYDMVGASITAHKQNQRRWAATPTAIASPHGAWTPGLAVAGTF